MTRADTRHLPGLDGLRAYLLFVILLFHCSVPGFSGGWIAVDVFFGLSGFLITRNLVGELERTGSVSLRAFWAGRSRRLLPALGTLLGTTLALVAVGALALTPTAAWGAVTYTTNWLHILVPGNGYWDAYAAPDPFEHLWSLAVEEQFYLLWPLVVLAVRRRGRRAVAIAAIVLATGSVATQVVGAHSGWSIDRLYQGTDTRALPFLLGALLASLGLPVIGRRLGVAVAVAALVVLGWSVHSLDGSLTSVYLGPLQAVSFAGVAIVAAAARTEGALLCHPALRAIGRWSYGIYLFHWPITVLVPSTWGWLPRLTIVTAASTAVAAATYRFIETPIRSRTWNGRRLIPASVSLAGFAIGAVIVAAPVTQGAAIARATNAVDWTDLASTGGTDDRAGGGDADQVLTGGLGGDAAASSRRATLRTPERVLVIGDSTANVLAHGLESTGRFEIVDGGMWGCPVVSAAEVRPLVDVERSASYCPSLDDQIAAVDLVRPDVVVIIASATEAWDQRYSTSDDAPWASPGDAVWRAAHDAHMSRFVSAHPDLPVVVVPAPSWRPPSMDALESPERRDAWNDQIQRWVEAHEQVSTMEYVRYLPEPGSDLDREMRPDGAHLTDTAIETLSREHLADDLVTAYRSVLSRMTSPR